MVHEKPVTLILGDFPFRIFDSYIIVMQTPKFNFDSLFNVRVILFMLSEENNKVQPTGNW